MISLSRAAGVSGEGVSPDVLLSDSVCMSSAAGPGREGAGLRRAVGVEVASGFSDSWLSVIASSVPGVLSLGPSCWRSTEFAYCACIATRVGHSVPAASGSLGGTCAAMAGDVAVTLAAVAPISQSCASRAVYIGVRGGPCGCSGRCFPAVLGPRSRGGCTDGVEAGVAACGAANGSRGLGVVLLVRVWEGAAEELDKAASGQ